MKVTIALDGRTRAFALAEQLQKRGHLCKLITTHPKFKVQEWEIHKEKITSLWPIELLKRGFRTLPILSNNSQDLLMKWFDRWSAACIPQPTEIFVGFSANPGSLQKAQTYGSLTIAERASSHILHQRSILREEYEKFNISIDPISESTIEKNLISYELADYIAIPSEFVEKSFLSQGIHKEKLLKIPYGIDLQRFHPVPKKDDRFRVIFVGRLGIQKGTYYLLEAMKDLVDLDIDLMLIGALEAKFKPIFYKYSNCFNYVGTVPHNEIYKYYSQASVFVHPSLQEGLARTQLEAMACGLPVIATTNTGGGEIIRDGKDGFIIPIRDAKSIKEKILYLYENEDARKEMSKSAKERVKEFTWDCYGERIVKVYMKILAEKDRDVYG